MDEGQGPTRAAEDVSRLWPESHEKRLDAHCSYAGGFRGAGSEREAPRQGSIYLRERKLCAGIA